LAVLGGPQGSDDFDVQRFGFVYVIDGFVFEIPYLSSVEECDSENGGWSIAFNDEGVPTSVQVCACSCAAFADAEIVGLLTRCLDGWEL